MMKIQPIPEQLWKALCIVAGEIEDILEHATKNDFDNTGDYLRLVEAGDLVTEFILCHDANGNVSQRGQIPQIWNENTIWTPHREVNKTDHLQLEFDWEENVTEDGEVNTDGE